MYFMNIISSGWRDEKSFRMRFGDFLSFSVYNPLPLITEIISITFYGFCAYDAACGTGARSIQDNNTVHDDLVGYS